MSDALPLPSGLASFRPRAPAPLRGLDRVAENATAVLAAWSRPRRVFLRMAAACATRGAALDSATGAELDREVVRLRELFRRGRATGRDLVQAGAVFFQAAHRELGQRPHIEQLAGGLAVHARCIAEMATGEGKTLAIVLPAVLHGWRGRGAHVVTANDYLASRDARWMTPLFERLGVRVSSVVGASSHAERVDAYRADVTYTTAREVAADLLRDSLTGRGQEPMLRGLACAIVDEADVVLIDDAATPLILSGGNNDPALEEAARTAAQVVGELVAGEHYRVDAARGEANLTPAGLEAAWHMLDRLEPQRAHNSDRAREEGLLRAIEALHLFKRGCEYVVVDGKVVIVDESTGRIMPDRSWRDGVHQAVEAKEGLPISPLKGIQSRISFQRFFRLYGALGGVSGTARECAREFWSVYRLRVVSIPTHAPCIRRQAPPTVLDTQARAIAAAANMALDVSRSGRPVLIGCRSVGESHALSTELSARGVPHDVLNALSDAREAAIIARAGGAGVVTIATNMAGRGTDIRLEAAAKEAGGLHVIAVGVQSSRRAERQLLGRAGRQGDPGSGEVLFARDDQVLTVRVGRLAAMIASAWPRLGAWLAQSILGARAARARRLVQLEDQRADEVLSFAAAGA